MWELKRKLFSWWSYASWSSKVVCLMLPLIILVSGFAAFPVSRTSYWAFTFHSSETYANSTTAVEAGGGSHGEETHYYPDDSGSILPAFPPLAMDAKEPLPVVGIKEESSSSSFNETHHHPSILKARLHRKYNNNIERIEAGLARARAAIKREDKNNGSQRDDPDFIPKGPMYLNANAFYRSYLEMEKRLKIFIYEEGEPPIFHSGYCQQTYAIEGFFIHNMEISPFRTFDPNKAQLFFLPFSVTMLTEYVYVPNSHQWGAMKTTAADYVNLVAAKHPYWNRTLGSDHFMLACHDWGPEISSSVPYLQKNSIRALCNANTSERFDPAKDVSIPEIRLPKGTTNGLLGGPSPSKRPVLVFFAGGLHGPIRPILLESWENKDKDVQIHKYLPKGVSYYDMMRKSRYCICPSGYEVASPRMVEALYLGCVPVLIKEGYVIPFSDVLDWKTFAVIIPVKDIPNLKKILTAIPPRQYIRMQRRGIQVRRHFEVNYPPKRFDVFHMILHSIWLRRLNIRLHADVA